MRFMLVPAHEWPGDGTRIKPLGRAATHRPNAGRLCDVLAACFLWGICRRCRRRCVHTGSLIASMLAVVGGVQFSQISPPSGVFFNPNAFAHWERFKPFLYLETILLIIPSFDRWHLFG